MSRQRQEPQRTVLLRLLRMRSSLAEVEQAFGGPVDQERIPRPPAVRSVGVRIRMKIPPTSNYVQKQVTANSVMSCQPVA